VLWQHSRPRCVCVLHILETLESMDLVCVMAACLPVVYVCVLHSLVTLETMDVVCVMAAYLPVVYVCVLHCLPTTPIATGTIEPVL
jgi:hypothetical protein